MLKYYISCITIRFITGHPDFIHLYFGKPLLVIAEIYIFAAVMQYKPRLINLFDMKKIFFQLFVLTLILSFGKTAIAQSYQTAAGLRFSYEGGASIKYFSSPNIALEGVLGFREKGVVVTGLFEVHQTAFDVAELKFYYGIGGHIGGVGPGGYRVYSGDYRVYNSSSLLFGADAVIGLEYLIPNTPIAVSADLDPRIEVFRGPLFNLAPSLGIKYVFK